MKVFNLFVQEFMLTWESANTLIISDDKAKIDEPPSQ